MSDRMEIGHDLNLFLDATRLVINRRTWSGRRLEVITTDSIHRHVRAGFVKAGRLLLLLEDFGIITRSGRNAFACTVERSDLEAKLTEIREAGARELVKAEVGDGS